MSEKTALEIALAHSMTKEEYNNIVKILYISDFIFLSNICCFSIKIAFISDFICSILFIYILGIKTKIVKSLY